MALQLVIGHFFHCYCQGRYQEILTEHLEALRESGLRDEIGTLYLGVVGPQYHRESAIYLCEQEVHTEVVVEAEEGWEQATLQVLWERASEFEAICYAHTKGVRYPLGGPPYSGAANEAVFNDLWRQSMTRAVVGRWKECVDLLKEYEAVGPHWIFHPVNQTGSEGEFIEKDVHLFGGNFWWARSDVITGCESPSFEHRYEAELWLGKNGVKDVYDLTPGWPALASFR